MYNTASDDNKGHVDYEHSSLIHSYLYGAQVIITCWYAGGPCENMNDIFFMIFAYGTPLYCFIM
jgi:hypothetical protein